MATIAFMPPREVAGIAMFPNPKALSRWPAGTPEPDYDRIYVVRIDNANPASFRVKVSSVPLSAAHPQGDLDQSHLLLASNATYDDRLANTGRNLDLKFKSKKGALVIFHLADPNATFVEDEVNSIVRNADDTDEILFNAKWVRGSESDREAVSVILIGGKEGTKRLDYGLGVRLLNDDPVGPGYTNIIIDPKVENEGHN